MTKPARRNFYLTDLQLNRLNSMSKKLGLSASEILRRAIDEYWERLEKKGKKRPFRGWPNEILSSWVRSYSYRTFYLWLCGSLGSGLGAVRKNRADEVLLRWKRRYPFATKNRRGMDKTSVFGERQEYIGQPSWPALWEFELFDKFFGICLWSKIDTFLINDVLFRQWRPPEPWRSPW